MIKILLNGCSGKMGKAITDAVKDLDHMEIIAGIDRFNSGHSYTVFSSINDVNIEYDVLVDYSRPDALNDLLSLTERTMKPLIICSTGFSKDQLDLISEKSNTLPLFKSGNMSLGINLVSSLLKQIAPILYNNFDIEIIEKHHNQKVDAPSGTALLLADSIKESLSEETYYVNGREGESKRKKNEIGIHAIRGGSIVGDHDVIFAGKGEVIELSHKALSREVFAIGTIKACEYMVNVNKPGLYDMHDVLGM